MGSCMSAIGTANPEYCIAQQDIYRFMVKAFGLDSHNANRLKKIYDGSGIAQRYSVIPDFGFADASAHTFFKNQGDGLLMPGTKQRATLYQQYAADIAAKAALNCFAFFEGDIATAITHLITVSCTGMYAPGIDIELVEKLGLRRDTERTCINFMGCYGAINALKVADYICQANPKAKVLVVSVELCTLHFQKENTLDNWVANSLFADGAAAALIEHQDNRSANNTALLLNNFYSEFIPEAKDDMAWYIGDRGFEMKLTSKVSKHIKKHIKDISDKLLIKAGLKFADIGAFAIHPGGRSILQAAEAALDIPAEANTFAYETLSAYGNMSSATILFVLQRLMASKPANGQPILSFAFGPGLTVESMILKAINP